MTLLPVHHHRMHLFGHDLNKTYPCTVRYLDDTSWETTYSKHEDSQKLFDRICNHVNLIEKDYFGLRFIDETKQRKWLDLGKNARKQLKKAGREEKSVMVSFRVKFYPPDPMTRLNEELTRYQLFLQLRRDLQHGRLYGSSSDESLLLACILQSELGDIPSITPPGTTIPTLPDRIPSDYSSLLKHGKKGEQKTLDAWAKLRGVPAATCEARFLEHASGLDTFGIDPHQVKGDQNEQTFLGYNHFGIIAFQGSRKVVHLDWAHILKMSYEKKTFLIYFVRDSKKNTKGYKCATPKAAKHLWRNALETKIFFTAPTSKNVGAIANDGSLFSRASRLRFSGRVAREAFDNAQAQQRPAVVFQRVSFGAASKPPDAEVYEGVLATPGLHRRPSIYPVGKERELSAARSAVSSPSVPSSPDSPGRIAPGGPKTDSPEPPEVIALPASTGWPVIPAESLAEIRPVTTENLLQTTKSRIEEVLSTSNGTVRLEPRVEEEPDDDVKLEPVAGPRAVGNTPLARLAVVGLIAGTALLSVYTLFETNWIPAEFVALLAPLRTSLYAPVKRLFGQLFFAGSNDTALVMQTDTQSIVIPSGGDV